MPISAVCQRQCPWSSSAVAAAPTTAPAVNRPWKRTRSPGRSESAAAEAMLMVTSTAPPNAMVTTVAVANAHGVLTSAITSSPAAHSTRLTARVMLVPQRSTMEAVMAPAAADTVSATASSAPNPPGPSPSAAATSAVDDGPDPPEEAEHDEHGRHREQAASHQARVAHGLRGDTAYWPRQPAIPYRHP